MANDVRIGVKAETQGVDAGMNRTDQSVKKVTRTVDDLGKAARKAAAEIDKIEVSARRLERVQKILSAEMGRSVSPSETKQFLERFEAMRTNRHLSGGGKLRQFGTFEDWHAGNRHMFVDPREADRYRRRVIGMAAGGVPGPGHHPDQQGPGGSNLMKSGLRGGMQMASGMMALAGVMGIMSMAGRAVDMAKDEAQANDQLLRSVGDLKTGFDTMQAQVRSSTEGLGVAFTEAAAMAKQFAKEANATSGTDIHGNMRTGMGMARAFGFDPQVGVGFMAQMRHYGTMDNDRNGKRMALMISEAIERGGVTAKADEVMSAVADFTGQVARFTLSAPNVGGFAGALASLTAPHIPGLDPRNAASMLMTADASMRRGGAHGEASLNLTYGAMTRQFGNMNPMLAMAMAEGGMFGTGASFAKSNLGKFYGSRGFDLSGISGSNMTNFEMVRTELERQYGKNNPMLLDAFRSHFGLQSQAQAAALYGMKGASVGGLSSLVGAAGLDVQNISATGIQNLAEIGTASAAGLRPLAKRLLGRNDISDNEKSHLSTLMQATGPKADEALRVEMARIVATREQEKNDGTAIREGVTGINNTLTELGGKLLPVITTIQQGVTAIAGAVIPDGPLKRRFQGMNDIPEYLGKSKDMERAHADAEKADAEWVEGKVAENGEKWRRHFQSFADRNAEARAFERQMLDQNYRDAISVMREQGGYGGQVPAGNPAGPATGGGQPIQLEVTGRLLDQMDRVTGSVDQTQVVVPYRAPAGTR